MARHSYRNQFEPLTENEQKLVADHIKTVQWAAEVHIKKYPRLRRFKDEIVSIMQLGLMRAAKTYKTNKGAKFLTYALWWMRSYTNREMAWFCRNSDAEVSSTTSRRKGLYDDDLYADLLDTIVVQATDIVQATTKNEQLELLHEALNVLPRDDAELLKQIYLDEIMQKDVAKNIGIGTQGIRKRQKKALERLRRRYQYIVLSK